MVIKGAGLRPIGKPLDWPPYPTIMRALHFYPDSSIPIFIFSSWVDVHVLQPEGEDGFAGWEVERGMPAQPVLGFEPWQTIAARELAARIPSEGIAVVDLQTSRRFRDRHIPGAWWAVRSRLDQASRQLQGARLLALTSDDGTLAHLAAPEAKNFGYMLRYAFSNAAPHPGSRRAFPRKAGWKMRRRRSTTSGTSRTSMSTPATTKSTRATI